MTSDERDRVLAGLELELSVLVRRLRRVIAVRARTIHDELTPAAYLVLAFVIERGQARPSVVADAFDLDKGAVSRLVQTLVDLGLASKERDPQDGRAWVIAATAAGRGKMTDLASRRRARLSRLLDDWSDDDLGAFVATLGRYNSSLD